MSSVSNKIILKSELKKLLTDHRSLSASELRNQKYP